MKFSGKMCFKIILKVTKNQGFTLSLEDTFFEKTKGLKNQHLSQILREKFDNSVVIGCKVTSYCHHLLIISPSRSYFNNQRRKRQRRVGIIVVFNLALSSPSGSCFKNHRVKQQCTAHSGIQPCPVQPCLQTKYRNMQTYLISCLHLYYLIEPIIKNKAVAKKDHQKLQPAL